MGVIYFLVFGAFMIFFVSISIFAIRILISESVEEKVMYSAEVDSFDDLSVLLIIEDSSVNHKRIIEVPIEAFEDLPLDIDRQYKVCVEGEYLISIVEVYDNELKNFENKPEIPQEMLPILQNLQEN